MKIYTKTVDKGKCTFFQNKELGLNKRIGTSSLYNGQRRVKDDKIFEALGQLSDITYKNVYFGLCMLQIPLIN